MEMEVTMQFRGSLLKFHVEGDLDGAFAARLDAVDGVRQRVPANIDFTRGVGKCNSGQVGARMMDELYTAVVAHWMLALY